MSKARNRLLAQALLWLGLSVIAAGQGKTPPSDPSFKLQALDGKIVDLSGERGNVVLVSFGATWCAPCTTELRSLNEVLGEYRGKPVKFFWVSIERAEQISNGDLKRYARERKLAFPVLRDTGQMVFLQFAEKVRLPMIIMLDKDGKVAGPATFGLKPPTESYKAEIRARLNKLLDLPSPAVGAGLVPAHRSKQMGGGYNDGQGQALPLQKK
jgi:thiol-disulfide isomerase/thioredoxin